MVVCVNGENTITVTIEAMIDVWAWATLQSLSLPPAAMQM